jgi:hypothetical protein
MNEGIETRLSKTLLSERAADFLAGGPADDATLIRHICEMPAAPPAVAARMAESLLAERPEQFVRGADGLWRLTRDAGAAPPAAAFPAPAVPAVPTFEEWQRQRAAERAAAARDPVAPTGAPAPAPAVHAAPGPHADRPLLDLSYAVVDVETTGEVRSPATGSPRSPWCAWPAARCRRCTRRSSTRAARSRRRS